MEADQPEFVLHEAFISNFWKGHGLGKPILGTKETVKKFGQEMLFDYFGRTYTPRNILITAAGNLNHEELVEMIREKFEGLEDKGAAQSDSVPKPHAPIVLKKRESLEQIHITLGVPAYP